MMVNNDCGCVPVVDEAGKPVGVVTDRDIACRIVAKGKKAVDLTAADCMSSPCVTVRRERAWTTAAMPSKKTRSAAWSSSTALASAAA